MERSLGLAGQKALSNQSAAGSVLDPILKIRLRVIEVFQLLWPLQTHTYTYTRTITIIHTHTQN